MQAARTEKDYRLDRDGAWCVATASLSATRQARKAKRVITCSVSCILLVKGRLREKDVSSAASGA